MPPPTPVVCPKPAAPAPKRTEPEHPQAVKWSVPEVLQAIVDDSDRSDADKKLDAGRHPAELLVFVGARPGWRVAEIQGGGGYTSELLARAVKPTGKVYLQNSKLVIEKFAAKPLGERLAKPVMKNVARVDREIDSPLPPDAKNLDAVVSHLVYHDAVWMGADRDKMNQAVFDSLKHGGVYVVVDHSAREGSGTQDVRTLHRIDEMTVIREVERAGFHLAAIGDFLRNPADARDWNAAPGAAAERRGTSDRFALRFVRP